MAGGDLAHVKAVAARVEEVRAASRGPRDTTRSERRGRGGRRKSPQRPWPFDSAPAVRRSVRTPATRPSSRSGTARAGVPSSSARYEPGQLARAWDRSSRDVPGGATAARAHARQDRRRARRPRLPAGGRPPRARTRRPPRARRRRPRGPRARGARARAAPPPRAPARARRTRRRTGRGGLERERAARARRAGGRPSPRGASPRRTARSSRAVTTARETVTRAIASASERPRGSGRARARADAELAGARPPRRVRTGRVPALSGAGFALKNGAPPARRDASRTASRSASGPSPSHATRSDSFPRRRRAPPCRAPRRSTATGGRLPWRSRRSRAASRGRPRRPRRGEASPRRCGPRLRRPRGRP